jgi:hypothetical protein
LAYSEWVVMTFGLKNACAMYQRVMNLIFHDLLGVLMEVYIDDVVVKFVGFEEQVLICPKQSPYEVVVAVLI